MEQNKKQLIFIDKKHKQPEVYDSFEFCDGETFLRINDRNSGINEDYMTSSLHWHNFYELEFVYEGKGRHIFGKTDCKMEKGFVCFRAPSTLHSTIQDGNNKLKLLNLQFSEDFISKIADISIFAPDNALNVTYSETELKEVQVIIKKMVEEIKNPDEYTSFALKAYFTKLFIEFIRKINIKNTETREKNSTIDQVIIYIRNNFRDNISLKSLAQTFFLTPNYLGELFKKQTGKSCCEYINDLRFSLARQLLLNTRHSVKEIATECGFNSTAYFIKIFKRKYGDSPLKFRQMNEKVNNYYTQI